MIERGEESLRSQIGHGKIERTRHREEKKPNKPREDRERGKQKRVDYTQRKVSRLGIRRKNRQIYPRKESVLGIERKNGRIYTEKVKGVGIVRKNK